MSRIGNKPLPIKDGATVTVEQDIVVVKGAKGELQLPLEHMISVAVEEGSLQVSKRGNSAHAQAMWGTTARLLVNMMEGVTEGFEKKLELNGVGFRMAANGNKLDLALGFSHPVVVEVPEGLSVAVDGMTLTITGIDKQKVGQFAAEVRALKPVEPYKGKGFKYKDEIVRRKEGKKAAA